MPFSTDTGKAYEKTVEPGVNLASNVTVDLLPLILAGGKFNSGIANNLKKFPRVAQCLSRIPR